MGCLIGYDEHFAISLEYLKLGGVRGVIQCDPGKFKILESDPIITFRKK